jgi:protein involved in polysaccharide export with SLBB domain
MKLWKVGAGAGLCAALLAPAAAAQQGGLWDFRAPNIARQQLEAVLARYQAAVQSPAYSAAFRAAAAIKADSVRARLQAGDLRAGDRLKLTVAEQRILTDSFTVTEGPALVLPIVGTVPLGGVLRSELEDRITLRVDSVYRDAPVQVVLLTRLAVLGGVLKPGFYSLPPDALIPDAITAAGGLTPDAKLTDIYVQRGQRRLWSADSLLNATGEGRTLGGLGIESGDRIVVPLPSVLTRNPTAFLQILPYLISLPLTLVTVVQLFK